MISLPLSILLLFIAGYTTQRASVCAIAAAQEIASDRRANRLTGALLSAAVSTLAMAIIAAGGRPVFGQFPGYAAMASTIIGAILFAVGAWCNGRCSMGTLAELAAGRLVRVGTVIGMVAGVFAGTRLLGPALGAEMRAQPLPSIEAGLAPWQIIAVASAISLLLYAALRHGLRRAPAPRFWSPVTAVVVAGIASGLLFALDQKWPYTSLISDMARGDAADAAMRIALTLVVVAGSTTAAVRGGLFQWAAGSPRDWAVAVPSGMVMGLGASLVPGGNEAMLYMGLPMALPHLAVAYAVTMTTLVLIAILSQRRRATAAA